MRWNGEFWEGNTTANTAPADTVTAEKLMAVMRQFERDFPPLPSNRFDIYGHMLNDVDGYELNLPDEMRPLHERGARSRRTLVVPKKELERWARALRAAGCDVRIEPRIPEPPPKMEHSPTGDSGG